MQNSVYATPILVQKGQGVEGYRIRINIYICIYMHEKFRKDIQTNSGLPLGEAVWPGDGQE